MTERKLTQSQSKKNPLVLLVSVVVVIQALVALYMGWPYFLRTFTTNGWMAKLTLFTFGLIYLIAAVWMFLVAHFFFRGLKWTRLAVLIIEIFAIILGVTIYADAGAFQAALALVPALIVAIATFLPPVVRYVNKSVRPGKVFS